MNRFKKQTDITRLKSDIKLNFSIIISIAVIAVLAILYYNFVDSFVQILLACMFLIGINTLLLFKLIADVIQYYLTKDGYLK